MHAAQEPTPAAAERPTQLYLISLVLVAAALLLAFGLDHLGKGARGFGTPRAIGREPVSALVVARPVDAYRAWRAQGFKGRTVVYLADAWDRLDPNRFREALSQPGYPLALYRIADRIERSELDDSTFLYVASLKGVARRIVAVLSPEQFAEARQAALHAKNASVGDELVYLTHQGFPRWFAPLPQLPRQEEPVLLYVAASTFKSSSPLQLIEALRRAEFRSDFVLLCSEQGREGVGEPERRALREFAALLERGGA